MQADDNVLNIQLKGHVYLLLRASSFCCDMQAGDSAEPAQYFMSVSFSTLVDRVILHRSMCDPFHFVSAYMHILTWLPCMVAMQGGHAYTDVIAMHGGHTCMVAMHILTWLPCMVAIHAWWPCIY
jgi:hypothetical protein